LPEPMGPIRKTFLIPLTSHESSQRKAFQRASRGNIG
jgi:hypothetical protein